ncbi:hypothetical protein D3C76_1390620 [compost metagenome]
MTRRVGGVQGEGGEHLAVAGAPGLACKLHARPAAIEPIEGLQGGDFFLVVAPLEQLVQQGDLPGGGLLLQHLGQQQRPRHLDVTPAVDIGQCSLLEVALALAAQERRGIGVRALGKLLLCLAPPLPLGFFELTNEILPLFVQAVVAHVEGRRCRCSNVRVHVGLIQRWK